MKCDLHVHSWYSGKCSIPLLGLVCRESYSDPEQVYTTLKAKGMDLVTLTDHDSVEGAMRLERHADFFVGEEVTCTMPSGTQIHVGVYGLTERQHLEVQRRRDDLARLLMYLSERRLFFSVNHVFSSLTGRRDLSDFGWFEEYFPAFEIQNSTILPRVNRRAKQLARRLGKIGIAGSDAHVLASVGDAYTEVPGARSKEEFLAGLRAGYGRARGGHGSYAKLTRDVLLVVREMVRQKTWTSLFSPLALLVPATTLGIALCDLLFASRLNCQLAQRGVPESVTPHWSSSGATEVSAWS